MTDDDPIRANPGYVLGQMARVLAAGGDWARAPVRPDEIGGEPSWLTAEGDLRTLPCHLPLAPAELSGMDGLYAARIVRGG